MHADEVSILGGVVVALAVVLLAAFVVARLTRDNRVSATTGKVIVSVLVALAALFAALPPVLAKILGH